jgi:FMN-dependent NADH-azoreductase
VLAERIKFGEIQLAKKVLLVAASALGNDSTSLKIGHDVIGALNETEVKTRDLSQGLETINQAWVNANFTEQASRSEAQNLILANSDELIAELLWADVLVIASPIYNFSVPSALKAWIDQVCRAGLTFNYTENGPVGLLSGKRAILAMSSGGVPVDSAVDFATPYLRQVLNFIGISDIQTVRADQQITTSDFMERAAQDIENLV